MFKVLMEHIEAQKAVFRLLGDQIEKDASGADANGVDANGVDADASGAAEVADTNTFQLPIAFLEQKTRLEEHTINDLELLPTTTESYPTTITKCNFPTTIITTPSLYTHVLNPDTVMGEKTLPLWSNYYTANTAFLKESQKLLKHKTKITGISPDLQVKVNDIWNEIQSETGFNEKYSYIEWERLQLLNNSSKFLQCLSIYNMASPIFSLMLPIFFLILPLLIIKMRGLPISINGYIELLKVVCKKHQLAQIFDLSKASFEKMLYVIGSAVFYAIQVYQNIMTCRRFYLNMAKIHEQIFLMRDYLEGTLCNMDIMQTQCQGLKTYEPFIENMNQHKGVYEYMLNEFKQVVPNKISIKKFLQVGHIMKCFYQLYQNEEFITSLKYSFGLNGYIDNLNGIRKNIISKNISTCTFKQSKFKSNNNKQSNKNNKPNKKNKINKTKFVDAYFPALVNENPIKNTYTLDKHLLITGPNAAGKTTLLKTTIFNIILSQQIGFGFYKKASLEPYDMIHCYINIPDTSARDSLFQAEAKRCKDILEKIGAESDTSLSARGAVGLAELAGATPQRHFCVFDELYSGTNPYEAVGSAYAFLTFLNKNDNVNFVLTTHFLDLCRRLEKQEKMNNYHMKIEVNEEDFKYTYKMAKGISTIKGGVKVLKDLDYPQEIINTTIETLKELEI